MLRLRVITAVVLLALLLPPLFHPGSSAPFAAVTLPLMGAAAWEWGRLAGLGEAAARWTAVPGALVLGGLWWLTGGAPLPGWAWTAATVAWGVGLVVVLRTGIEAWGRWPRGLRLGVGWLALALAWWALITLHALGAGVLLGALLLVWAADIAAYFGGRAWGRRKLAPRISPGKSWEGALCGGLAVLALAAGWVALGRALGGWWAQGLFPRLWAGGAWAAVPWLVLLTGLSVAGDLFESLVKRSAGVKDSSGLLPGHGGVLDRIDALLPVLPAVLAALAWQGGRA
ncbi:Phosphatidate cytidylyltransferase [Tepidimonas sediminis]|uniref:Phosphatidate cytidylyltransferase n=1 Tax=Tepidimonas sediminis TaxID=2588941 RepID=A0A554WPH4_9BURK|nr:phosphatidate cytidylyltransferase [Tepidimonas sediminis]TSE25479.1 Phosphatidate cytidylyltransferase [Tepidimonas sediminis]